MGPQHPFSASLHAEKYRAGGEDFREAMNRIAAAMQDDEEHYHTFREILREMRFMPGGRIQAAMGSTKAVTAYNCFVSATIEDSFTAGQGSIMECASRSAETMRMGGGIGYDFSTLRPRGATIKKLQSSSSGPISFMEIFDAICRCVSSSGHRRGAQMGVLRVDHPDIEEFIHAKREEGRLEGFNISVAITDEFMIAVENKLPFDLRFGGQVYKTIDACALWESIMRSAWDWAEPGVLFIDAINRMNNLHYCEKIAATNPCGEQPLPPDGACLLGSFNLVKYLVENWSKLDDGTDVLTYTFDFDQLVDDIEPVVRAMDNVIDRSLYPLYEQEKEAKSKRRMGLGVTGLANTIEAMGYPYGSADFVIREEAILRTITVHAYKASIKLAKEKGSFPLFDVDAYLVSGFLQRPEMEEVRELIGKYGIRNSHLTSIAPTGTISMAADNVSSGIEPVFAYEQERIYIGPDGPETVTLPDYGFHVLGVRGRTVPEVTVAEHLAVLKCAARWADSAVSKTINLTKACPWEVFKNIFMEAWKAEVKGCTVYNVDGRRGAILTSKDEEEEGSACRIDSETGRHECD